MCFHLSTHQVPPAPNIGNNGGNKFDKNLTLWKPSTVLTKMMMTCLNLFNLSKGTQKDNYNC